MREQEPGAGSEERPHTGTQAWSGKQCEDAEWFWELPLGANYESRGNPGEQQGSGPTRG